MTKTVNHKFKKLQLYNRKTTDFIYKIKIVISKSTVVNTTMLAALHIWKIQFYVLMSLSRRPPMMLAAISGK